MAGKERQTSMAYLFAPRPSFEQLPIFYNVEAPVGAAPAANNREDVLLVQFILSFISKSPAATYTPEMIAACRAVQFTGIVDQATIKAIREYQKLSPGWTVDGRVSPANGYSYGANIMFTIVGLNNSLQNRTIDVWPRIDKIPGCPQELIDMTKRTVVGNKK
jgi:hypothetical protein